MSNNSLSPIDRTLSVTITAGQSRPQSNDNEWVFRISHSTSITEASPSDCFVSYAGHSVRESFPSADMQSVYSTTPTD